MYMPYVIIIPANFQRLKNKYDIKPNDSGNNIQQCTINLTITQLHDLLN